MRLNIILIISLQFFALNLYCDMLATHTSRGSRLFLATGFKRFFTAADEPEPDRILIPKAKDVFFKNPRRVASQAAGARAARSTGR